MTSRYRALLLCLSVLLSVSTALGIGEVLARITVAPTRLPAPPSPRTIDPYLPNPYFFFSRPFLQVYIPGSTYQAARSAFRVTYRINRQGFRGPEIAARTPAGRKRLLVIGDSIVEGHGVEFEEIFTEILGTNLLTFGWEVVNAGVAGGSPIYYAANVPRYVSLQPDAALIVIFENDLYDDRDMESHFFSLPLLDDEQTLLAVAPNGGGCCESRLYTALRQRWSRLDRSPVARIVARNRARSANSAEQEEWRAIARYLIAPSMIDREWTMSQAYLDYTVASFRRQKVAVLIAGLCLGTLAPTANEPYYRTHCRQLNDRIAAWAHDTGLPFLSLVPTISALFKERGGGDVMLKDDGHPTRLTHAALEGTLRPWVLQHLAVK